MTGAEGIRGSGRDAEVLAQKYLRSRGYKILETNYATPLGEIDVIALDGRTLVFVEVRSRAPGSFGGAAESITRSKQGRIARAAAVYIAEKRLGNVVTRFDVVAVRWPGPGGRPEVELVADAFDSPL